MKKTAKLVDHPTTNHPSNHYQLVCYCGGLWLVALLLLSACGGNASGDANSNGDSSANGDSRGLPDAVTTLRYTDQILQWDPQSAASYYQLQYSSDGSNYNDENAAISAAQYTIDLEQQGYYRLRACNANNACSAYTTFVHATLGAVNSAQDFDTLAAAGNNRPSGIWSDGITLWVADLADSKIYAYDMVTKARDAAKDFDTLAAQGNADPTALWSDGTTMWVVDELDDKIYAYDLISRMPDIDKDFDLAEENVAPRGFWSSGTGFYVSDVSGRSVYVYSRLGTVSELDVSEEIGTGIVYGLWSDGTTLWVVDNGDMNIYAYELPSSDIINSYQLGSEERDSAKDFDTLEAAGNTNPWDIWSDGITLWVADDDNDKIYAYVIAQTAVVVLE